MKITKYLLALPFFMQLSCGEPAIKKTPIPEVNVVEAGVFDVPIYAEYVGQVYGEADVTLRPRVEGWITAIHFKEGNEVNKGDILYTIEDVQLQNKVASAQANLTEAEVRFQKAKSDLERVEPLVAASALSQRDLDEAKANFQAQKENVNSAKAMKNNADTEAAYAKITAPISGIIGISKVQVGDYVSKVGVDNSINTISSTQKVKVRFAITENEFLKYKKRREEQGLNPTQIDIQLILSDGTLFPEIGVVDFADRSIDPLTGTLTIQAVFNNPKKTLRPGQYAKIRFKADDVKQAVIVPQQAINQLQNTYRIFVLNDSNQIQPRVIKVGARNGSNWVITEGLKPTEKVAVLGNAIVKPGMAIKPVKMNWNYDSTLVK